MVYRVAALLMNLLLALAAWTSAGRAADPSVGHENALPNERAVQTALDRYVQRPDPSYRWKLLKTFNQDGFTTYVVDVTSQTWRTTADVDRTEWKHWLVIVKPHGVKLSTAMLFIGGGSNRDRVPGRASDQVKTLALATRSVVAELRMVPNQPLVFRGDGKPRYEDDLIAYTWDKFMTTGDETWVARLPMVKSAVRAMDTVQALLAGPAGGKLNVEKFVVAGASKRGWTTWLTAAVDRRVVAIIPIVIDALNVRASFKHHYAAYGFWAPAVGDYVRLGIPQREDSPQYAALLKIADPYEYRHRLALPKYLVNSTGDEFFLPDSSRFYFGDLPGEKYLRYVPNTNHSLGGSDALQGILAFYRAILNDTPRPRFSWTFKPENSITVVTRDRPREVRLWRATSEKARDFRLDTIGRAYQSSPLAEQDAGRYVAKIARPATGWTAFFVELVYDSGGTASPAAGGTASPAAGGTVPFRFTTEVRIVPDVLPHKDKPIGGKK